MDQSSLSLLSRFSGYALLILSLFDLLDILIPLHLMDSPWQFETLGQLVERVPIPIIGLFLVFYGVRDWLAKWEKSLLNIISLGTLLAGIGYLILVPVGVVSALQIDRFNDNQMKQQIAQNATQGDSIKKQIKEIKTETQMQALLNKIEQVPPEISESQQLENSKQKLTNLITVGAENLANQSQQNYFQKRLQLLKQSVKWNLGSLITGVLFIVIWNMTKFVYSDLEYDN